MSILKLRHTGLLVARTISMPAAAMASLEKTFAIGLGCNIKEVDEGIWLVSSCTTMGYTDLEQKTLQPLHNLYRARLSQCLRNKLLRKCPGRTTPRMAVRVGFEPTIRFPVYTLSKRAPSTTRPPHLRPRVMHGTVTPNR
jgi:predicted transcriptional regulator